MRYQGGHFRSYDGTNGLPSDLRAKSEAIALDRAGTKWIGTSDGLEVFGAGGHKRFTQRSGLPGNRITALVADREGAVWVGTEAGLARIENDRVERLPPNDGLSNNPILSLFEDREGNLWVGTDSAGLTILRNQKFVTYSFGNGIADDQIRCVFEDRRGVVWVGTNGIGLRRFANGQFSELTTRDGLSSNIILALAEDAQGNLLAGTPDGLNRIGKEGISVITSADGLAEDFVRSIFVDGDGSLWAGTRRGLTHLSEHGAVTYTQADGLGNDLVGALLRDRSGDLWIGTLHGLTRLRNDKFTNYTVRDGLSGNVITDLLPEASGEVVINTRKTVAVGGAPRKELRVSDAVSGRASAPFALLIATQDGGLSRYRDGSFQRIGAQSGLPVQIFGLAEDANRDLWLAAKTGIYQVKGRSRVIAYGPGDGLQVRECGGGGHPAVWKDHRGAIWFSTTKGVAVLAPDHNTINRVPPPVVLEAVSVDDQVFMPAELGKVKPGHSRLSFEYAGLSYTAPQKVEYRYRLAGFDPNWVNAGTRRVAYYTNVPPGRYRFEVTACNNDGVWNASGVSFGITVEPHFYQTWWSRTALLLLACLAVYAFYYRRLRQVEKEFDLVLRERNRIAREIHDTLAQGFVGVAVQLELVSRLMTSSGDSAREHLDRARTLVRQYLAEARQSIWELRSQGGDAENFVNRFSKLARQMSESSGVRVSVAVHGVNRRLARHVEDELFRIGQEAVTNAIRHSGAQRITIDLTFDAKKLRMTIIDDGRGFKDEVKTSGPDGHFGLQGMRERAEQIHADLVIESLVGTGTTVSVEAPAK